MESLFLLATAAKTLRPVETDETDAGADETANAEQHSAVDTPAEHAETEPQPPPPVAVARAPLHQQKAMAEQRRREALEESLNDFLPRRNLLAVGKMNEEELNESKNLLMCFLSGRGSKQTMPSKAGGAPANEHKDASYINDFQHDMRNISMSYHYTHDPALPLQESLLDRPKPKPEKKGKHSRTEKHHKKNKAKIQKTKNTTKGAIENLLTKIDNAHLVLALPPPNPNEHDTEEEDATEPQPVNVPTIVRVTSTSALENLESNDVLDESVRSSQNSFANNSAVEDSSVFTSNPASYDFHWVDKKGWRCKRCSAVPLAFQAAGSLIVGSADPDPKLMHSHKHACRGDKADLSKLVDVVLKLTRATSIKFRHLQSKEFQSIVRLVVSGKEEFVTLFTTDLRNRWYDPIKHKSPSATVDWSQYPSKIPRAECAEKLISAVVVFAKKYGLGFDFVANEYFMELFKHISPECCLPAREDLITSW